MLEADMKKALTFLSATVLVCSTSVAMPELLISKPCSISMQIK
jgi:hypothetical protein